jgi:F0F1-type ATP synthase membrane subunit c/vacuolar-type H+-ATPase subunit K
VILLAGEWVGAGLGLGISFLVASLGVVGLGWWVLRGDARNRAAETKAESAAKPEHEDAPPKSGH